MDPAKMKVVDLRSELGALGLDTKGNKPALVERLKKALEAKTGKVLADTSILDTTTEDVDDVATPRRPGPAARTTRRSSSSRLAATPSKPPREDPPESIEEDKEDDVEMIEPVKQPQPVPAPVPAPVPEPAPKPVERTPEKQKPADDDVYEVDDKSQSPIHIKEDVDEVELVENQENKDKDKDSTPKPKEEKMDQDAEDNDEDEDAEGKDDKKHDEKRDRELTEEEEWEILNERLKIKEQERLEREKKQAEEDAKLLEEVSKDPIKLQRLKRKQEKKARWSNFYKSVEVTNEVLAPPVEPEPTKGKKEVIEPKVAEPEINDERVTLSWYDSDLHQYLELPELNGVVPLSEGVFSHAWAGCRATHGAEEGRVCYEVRVGTVVTTTETTEGAKDALAAGLRMGWSTDDMNLHLGEGELSWGYETTGRAVHNSEFKEYGKSLVEKDVVGVYLDLESSPCKISYTVNGVEQGVAYEFDKSVLGGKPLFPHVLTKNMCYKVNFGYDRYNMLTKTKIVRKRIEVPLEQVLEEKKALEEEIRRQKEEAAKRARERRERDKKEREERQRKKREERERIAREKKEKELQEKKDKEAEEGKNTDADANADEEKDKDKEKEKTDGEEAEAMDQSADSGNQDEPKENGDKTEIQPVPEVKEEPMETEQVDEAKVDTTEQPEVKGETVDDDVVEVTEDQVLKGLVLDKRIKFVIRHTAEEELEGAEACLLPGYVLLAAAQTVPGPRPPADRTLAEAFPSAMHRGEFVHKSPYWADGLATVRQFVHLFIRVYHVQVILMVGMPGAGKTYWARQHSAAHPERRYNILSTGALFDRMKVDCKPFRTSYEGRWDAMVSKCAKCVQKLLEIAKGRRRNYILDQTNVYPSAQRRKLKEFDGYRRVAVVVVTDDETYRERHKRREETDGKEVPDGAVVDMKANFALPEKCSWLDEVTYAELGEEEAKQVIEAMHKEARAAGVLRDKDKRERSASRDAPPAKRPRDERRHAPDRRARDAPRDRDRWGGGGGGSRWGPAARGGGGGGGAGGASGAPGAARGARPDASTAGAAARPPDVVVTISVAIATVSAAVAAAAGVAASAGGTGDTGARRGAPRRSCRRGPRRTGSATTGTPARRTSRTSGPRGDLRKVVGQVRGSAAAAAVVDAEARRHATRSRPRGTSPPLRKCKIQTRTRIRTKTNKTRKVGTSGLADGVVGAIGTKTRAGEITGAIGATRRPPMRTPPRTRTRSRTKARTRLRTRPRLKTTSSGRPTIPRSSGISGSSGSSSSRAGKGTNSSKVPNKAICPMLKLGRSIIRTTAVLTPRLAIPRKAAATRSNPTRVQTLLGFKYLHSSKFVKQLRVDSKRGTRYTYILTRFFF